MLNVSFEVRDVASAKRKGKDRRPIDHTGGLRLAVVADDGPVRGELFLKGLTKKDLAAFVVGEPVTVKIG